MPVLLISTLMLAIASIQPTPSDVHGKWVCGPYELKPEGSTALATDHTEYRADGSYQSDGKATYVFDTSDRVTVQMRHVGTWNLSGDVLEIEYTSAEFISSDSPLFTVEAGQAALDAQMKKKSWTKKRVLSYSPDLVTIPIGALNKAAEIEVRCTKA